MNRNPNFLQRKRLCFRWIRSAITTNVAALVHPLAAYTGPNLTEKDPPLLIPSIKYCTVNLAFFEHLYFMHTFGSSLWGECLFMLITSDFMNFAFYELDFNVPTEFVKMRGTTPSHLQDTIPWNIFCKISPHRTRSFSLCIWYSFHFEQFGDLFFPHTNKGKTSDLAG